MKNNHIIITILVAVVAICVGFFAGTKYPETKIPNITRQFNGGFNRNNMLGGPQMIENVNFLPLRGSIMSFDDTSITVKLSDGSSKIVILSDRTIINKTNKGEKTDLKKGITVVVTGTEGADKIYKADTIEINPRLFRGQKKEVR